MFVSISARVCVKFSVCLCQCQRVFVSMSARVCVKFSVCLCQFQCVFVSMSVCVCVIAVFVFMSMCELLCLIYKMECFVSDGARMSDKTD